MGFSDYYLVQVVVVFEMFSNFGGKTDVQMNYKTRIIFN